MANQTTDYTKVALGVYVGPSALEGVLIGLSDDGPAQALHRIVRQRRKRGEFSTGEDLESVVPGLKSSEDSDFTIEIGGGRSGSGSGGAGLTGLSTPKGSSSHRNGASSQPPSDQVPFDQQLKDILDECARMGYADPSIAFCATPPEVTVNELVVPTEAKKNKRSNGSPSASRKELLALYEKEHGAVLDRERLAFYPMTPEKGCARYLAVAPTAQDNVMASLKNLQERNASGAANARLLETEATLYADLIQQHAPSETANSAVVRVGSDDTIILFFEGAQLRHYERMRSLTSYDVPETICSRVMLQQDEQKVGELDALYVLSSREDRLTKAFRKQYPHTAILPLQDLLPPEQWQPEGLAEGTSTAAFPAITAALRLFFPTTTGERINLIGSAPKRRRVSLAFAWHTYAALFLLLASMAFFGWTFVENQAEIAEQRQELQENPVEMPDVTPQEVRQNITAIQQEYAEYNRALQVLDSLLVGSDKWSRTLAQTSSLTGAIPQIWFSRWSPRSSTEIAVDGFALSRGNVARLARELDAEIEQVEYNEINDRRIYTFVMAAPIAEETPEVAQYLQDVAEGALPRPVSDADDAGALLEISYDSDGDSE